MTSMKPLQVPTPDYRDTYALGCSPFENGTDPRFFYASTSLMQRLDLLIHLTQFGDSVVLVAGPPGSGKTTLLEQFAAQAGSRWQLCVLNGSEPKQLEAALSSALGASADIPWEDALSRWEDASSQLLVVVVDNAEHLEQHTCDRLCSLLSLPQGDRVRIVLFGTGDAQPRVKQALAQQAAGRSLQLLDLPRLSEEETAAYLMYRLAVAGYSGESPFAATEVRAICKAADGRPAAVNRLAHETLTEHVLRNRSKRQASSPSKGSGKAPLWLAATGVVLMLVAYAGWQRFAPPALEEAQLPELARAPMTEEVPLTIPGPAQPEPSPAKTPAADGAPPEPETTPGEDPLADSGNLPKAVEVPETAEAPAPPRPSGSIEQEAPSVPAAPEVDASTTVTRESGAIAETTAENGKEKQSSAAALAPAADIEALTTEAAGAVDKATPTPESAPHREAWLLSQPRGHYSLQLLGSRSEQAIAGFIKQHKLDADKTAYYRGKYKNADWFVLMYGVYPSRQKALQEVGNLPAAIRKQQPWPRELLSVHQAIEESRSQ